MATAASIIGPLLLLMALATAHQAREWVARHYVATVPAAASSAQRNTAAHEAMTASSVVAVVTLGASLVAFDAATTPFTSGWGALAFGVGAACWFARAWPRFGRPLHPSSMVLLVLRAGLIAAVFSARFLVDGAIGVVLAAIVIVGIAAMLRWEDEIFAAVGLTAPVPESWAEELERAGIGGDEVRLRKFTMSMGHRGSGRTFMPSAATSKLTSHQAAGLIAFNLQTTKVSRRWWLAPHVIWPSLLVAAIVGPTVAWAVFIIAVSLIAMSLVLRPRQRREIAEVNRRLGELARYPIEAASLAQAIEIFEQMTQLSPAVGRRGLTGQDVAERLGHPRNETLEPPSYWSLAVRMLPVSLVAAALPLALAAPVSWALGPRAQAVVAVGTDLGSDVEPARRAAAIIDYYDPYMDDEDIRVYVERAQREILRTVDDRDLHREAIALYLAECSARQSGDGYVLFC